jgi:hypothetical protein
MKITMRALIGSLLLLAACGKDQNPIAPSPPVPSVAGTYNVNWQVQFHRNHDGFEGTYACYGTLTMAQDASSGGRAALSGFAVVQGGCPQGTFELSGSVSANGSVTFTTVGPRPSQGQCPFAPNAAYSGLVSAPDGNSLSQLSAHASLTLDCPGPGEGEHRFDYVIQGWK